jgi:hypothetical protein
VRVGVFERTARRRDVARVAGDRHLPAAPVHVSGAAGW